MNYSDLLMIGDSYQVKPPRPFTPGQEISGQDVAVGPQPSRFDVGDHVMAKVLWGGFAEYALARLDMALPAPSSTPLMEAAAIPVSFTPGAVALTEFTVLKGHETILIHAAAGAVGLATVQIAKVLGPLSSQPRARPRSAIWSARSEPTMPSTTARPS